MSALRAALSPLADSLDDDVIEYIKSMLAEVGSATEADDCLVAFLPGFEGLHAKRRKDFVQRAMEAAGRAGAASPAAASAAAAAPEKENRTRGGAGSKSGSSTEESSAGSSSGSGSGSGGASSAAAAASASGVPAKYRGGVQHLRGLYPHLSDADAVFVLDKCEGNVETAAEYVLDHDVAGEVAEAAAADAARAAAEAERRTAEARADAAARARMLARFDEAPDDAGKRYAPTLPQEMLKTRKKGEKELKWVDGQRISVPAGQKFLIEAPKEEFGQVHSLKIKKKGQGGASPGFKK